ncbi:MAG: hypothetical protein HF982_01085 [Desulfobacteraceae bacterium]|nr:hypothetical protein [Desulfobacteraceae bacterium]MBC2718193.1 hypothetical protein [Desulfobacteraceae bacterium]
MILYLNKYTAPVVFGCNYDIVRADKPAPHLKPINYNPWAQLEFKHELNVVKKKEKQALEKKKMAVIESVHRQLREDKEVHGRIRGCG